MLSIYLPIGHLFVFFENVCSVLCLFFNWTLFFEMLSCTSSLYILSCVLWIFNKYLGQLLPDLHICKYLSFHRFPFTLLTFPSMVEVFSLMEPTQIVDAVPE